MMRATLISNSEHWSEHKKQGHSSSLIGQLAMDENTGGEVDIELIAVTEGPIEKKEGEPS